MTMPFLRLSAPSRVTTSVLPSGVVITSLIVRAFTTIESTIVGFSFVEMSIVYTRSPPSPVPRYATLPLGCSQTSVVKNVERGTRPTTFTSRCTSRGATVMNASALRTPYDAVT